ncbi:class I SAM-dependent methyltransferase [Aliiglaciecola sp. SL4]|uniref:class I SAM-dependent methyltransferase n=1 Tax=Aliiglaciecola sp. SL4 TaxID=3239806 RepID=UPI00355C93C9
MEVAREIRRFKRWTKVWGLNRICPFCCRPQRNFMPAGLKSPLFEEMDIVGGGYRSNAKCLVCGSMDRERLIYLYLKNKTDILQGHKKVLHIAPEPVLMKTLAHRVKQNYIRANIKGSRADVFLDVRALPFSDNAFDFVITNHVLEHVHEDKMAISEIKRVMKQDTGISILQVPLARNLMKTRYDPNINSNEQRLAHFGQEDHVRLYGRDYSELLQNAGLSIEVFDWSKDKSMSANKNRYGLIEHEKVYVCRKKK